MPPCRCSSSSSGCSTVPLFAITDVAKELELTHRGAALIVEKLVGAGIAKEMTGQARNRVFASTPILDIVGEGDPKPTAR